MTEKSISPKDMVIQKPKLIKSLIPNKITECSLNRAKYGVCMLPKTSKSVAHLLGIVEDNPADIVEIAKEELNCDTEKCVLNKLRDKLGDRHVDGELRFSYKVPGPTDNALLTNVNIDSIMGQWAVVYKDFFAYNFNMKNYASYSFRNGRVYNTPDTLSTILFKDLYTGAYNGTNYRCCGCVINTDVYQGDGKHWMALFADTRGDQCSVEFFNSSGNGPAVEWVSWLQKTKIGIESVIESENRPNRDVKVVKVSSIRHQQSKSECGLYSLFYIWSRLNGTSYDYFLNNSIPDQFMFEFRQHLFDATSGPKLEEFDWEKYKDIVNIKWEKN
jgi:hypothetical protein